MSDKNSGEERPSTRKSPNNSLIKEERKSVADGESAKYVPQPLTIQEVSLQKSEIYR